MFFHANILTFITHKIMKKLLHCLYSYHFFYQLKRSLLAYGYHRLVCIIR